MGFLLPYFHGARKRPTSALCLIPLPIPRVETFPERQGASSFPKLVGFLTRGLSFQQGEGWEQGVGVLCSSCHEHCKPLASGSSSSIHFALRRQGETPSLKSVFSEDRRAGELFFCSGTTHSPCSPQRNPLVLALVQGWCER